MKCVSLLAARIKELKPINNSKHASINCSKYKYKKHVNVSV